MSRSTINNGLKVLVTLGLGTGYLIVIGKEFTSGNRVSAIGNSILLPASLIWLWLITDDS